MTMPPSANARKISSLSYDKLRELKGANPPTQKDLACFLKRKFSEFINLTILVIFQFIGVHFIVYLLHESLLVEIDQKNNYQNCRQVVITDFKQRRRRWQ